VGTITTLGWLSVLISAQLGQMFDKLLSLLSGLGVNDDLQLPQRIGLPGSCLDMCLVRLLLLAKVLSQTLHVCFFLVRSLASFLVCVITLGGRVVASTSMFGFLALVPSCCKPDLFLFLILDLLRALLHAFSQRMQ
jgi:hypothetical protein